MTNRKPADKIWYALDAISDATNAIAAALPHDESTCSCCLAATSTLDPESLERFERRRGKNLAADGPEWKP